jgi:hypothetical protein
VAVTAGKTPYVRFDLNDYSIPHTHVRRPLIVLADPDEVRIVDGQHILAHHRRSYDKGAQIEDAAHIQALVEQRTSLGVFPVLANSVYWAAFSRYCSGVNTGEPFCKEAAPLFDHQISGGPRRSPFQSILGRDRLPEAAGG